MVRREWAIVFGVLLQGAVAAHADIAVLANGQTLKLVAQRLEGDSVTLSLKDGGEVTLPSTALRGVLPDEVVEQVVAEVEAATRPSSDIPTLVAEAARRHGLDPALVLAVVAVESNFQPQAVSPKGAQGLMQLMPATAHSLGVSNAFDPVANVEAGARHLSALVSQYQGDIKKALAAYNAGAGAVSRYGGIPPYQETRDYVERVLRRYGRKP